MFFAFFYIIIAIWAGCLQAEESLSPMRPLVTVFVHGTVGSILHAPQMFAIKKNAFNPLKIPAIAHYRNHPLLGSEQFISAEQGLYTLQADIIDNYCTTPLLTSETGHARYHLASIYHHIHKRFDSYTKIRQYAYFNWSGFLSSKHRKDSGKDLYQELIKIRTQYREQGELDPVFVLIAHSHGGNVCLHLHDAEQEYKQQLIIEELTLLGTPIHQEMKECIRSLIFKSIICHYSEGDSVQNKDTFTTQCGKSFVRMRDIVNLKRFVYDNPGYHRSDVRIMVEGDAARIDHTNLWFLGRGAIIFKEFDQFPYTMFLPYIHGVIAAHKHGTQFCIDLYHTADTFVIKGSIYEHGRLQPLDDVAYPLNDVRLLKAALKTQWRPFDAGRHALFNAKNIRILQDVLFAKKN